MNCFNCGLPMERLSDCAKAGEWECPYCGDEHSEEAAGLVPLSVLKRQQSAQDWLAQCRDAEFGPGTRTFEDEFKE